MRVTTSRICLAALVFLGPPALAGGEARTSSGSTVASASPTSEGSLRDLLARSSQSLSALDRALGMQAPAARQAASADCVSSRSCSVAAALDALKAAANEIRDELRGRKADETRLGGDFGDAAADAVRPLLQALPQWQHVARDLPQDATALRQSPALAQAAPKLRPTLQSLVESLRTTIDYLRYSGVATQPLESALAQGTRSS
ncbi:MAG TPA: hypothetical protein VME21_17120 [Steroidobacteraceae bacterium]|nr:hypothetical protein [Steroidobacteraceae bacterium]